MLNCKHRLRGRDSCFMSEDWTLAFKWKIEVPKLCWVGNSESQLNTRAMAASQARSGFVYSQGCKRLNKCTKAQLDTSQRHNVEMKAGLQSASIRTSLQNHSAHIKPDSNHSHSLCMARTGRRCERLLISEHWNSFRDGFSHTNLIACLKEKQS